MYTIVVNFPTIASIILPLILVFSISFYRKFTYSWWKTARAWDIKAREIIMRWSFVVNEFEQGNKKKKKEIKRKKRKTSTMNLPFLNIIYCFIYCILSALPSFIALSGLCERVILLLFVVNHVSSYKSGQKHSGGTSAVILCYLGADCTLNMKFLTAVNTCLRLITNCAMSWMQSLEKKISCFDI